MRILAHKQDEAARQAGATPVSRADAVSLPAAAPGGAAPAGGEVYRAGLPVLGARLLTAAKLVAPGRPVADIGCDHGKLAVWLALRGAPRVVAVDSRPMPLARAQALVRQTGCEARVQCRLGYGMAPLAPAEVGEVIIAGLSGETIIEILEGCAWVQSPALRFVLVPATRQDYLRRWLYTRGFALVCERPVQENGRAYAVMRALYTGRAEEKEELFYQLGLLGGAAGVPDAFLQPTDWPPMDREALAIYIRARLRYLRKQTLAPMDEDACAAHRALIQEVEKCLP